MMTEQDFNIPPYQEVIQEIGALLENNLTLSALYINCSRISKIEGTCGKKRYSDIMKKISEIIIGMKGNEIRKTDIIVSNTTGSEEFIIFLSRKRDDRDFFASDLETLCARVTEHLNKAVFPVTFSYLRGDPKITVGYAIVIHNPLMRDERLINKLIEDAKHMAKYYEFKRVMRYKEKLQDLILKESIRTIFQPIVDVEDNKIIGYEALTRGPEGTEFENPYLLFDAAAESDLLFELDRLCRTKAIENAKGLDKEYKLFMNCLPTVVLDPGFRDAPLIALLERAKIGASRIVFEITEREAIENYDLFMQAVKHYTDLGFAIAVDDTGAGFSSLETVIELKPHYIKLDISLIRGIEKNPMKQELIKAIRNLSIPMNSLVIAEGIETLEELSVLRKLGISLGQGYLFAKPGIAFPGINQINRR